MAAHPGRISALAASHDGKHLFSCGGADLTVNMWAVDLAAFDDPLRRHLSEDVDERLEPYIRLLEGGREGQLYNDLVDYFYCFQLKRQGDDAMEVRLITGNILYLT